jgi:hypothetical protein
VHIFWPNLNTLTPSVPDDVPATPTEPRLPGTYRDRPRSFDISTIMEMPEQRTPVGSVFVHHSDSSSEVHDLEQSGLLSPSPQNPFVEESRNERRYRMVLQHDFHASRVCPSLIVFAACDTHAAPSHAPAVVARAGRSRGRRLP